MHEIRYDALGREIKNRCGASPYRIDREGATQLAISRAWNVRRTCRHPDYKGRVIWIPEFGRPRWVHCRQPRVLTDDELDYFKLKDTTPRS